MKKLFKLLIISPFFITVLYCGSWFFIAQKLKEGVNQFYEIDGVAQGYKFHGDKPALSGFPFKPVMTYTKGFSKDDLNVQFEKLTVSAFPFPYQPLYIKIDELSIHPEPRGQLYEINELTSTLIIPKSLPSNMTQAQLIPWQKEIGKINIKSLEINKNSMMTTAHGFIGLDNSLQPTLSLDTTIQNYENLIRFMSVETDELKPIPAAIALGVLNGMAETDEATGKKFVQVDIIIKNQKLRLGPINLSIPTVRWR